MLPIIIVLPNSGAVRELIRKRLIYASILPDFVSGFFCPDSGKPQALPQRRSQAGLIQCIEMQSRCFIR